MERWNEYREVVRYTPKQPPRRSLSEYKRRGEVAPLLWGLSSYRVVYELSFHKQERRSRVEKA